MDLMFKHTNQNNSSTNLALCLLTLNSVATTRRWLDAFFSQTLVDLDSLVIDSSSNDGTQQQFTAAGFRVHTIPYEHFNHGTTRQLAVELCRDAEILIFMTQDAFLASPDSLKNLVAAFSDPSVGAAFGRQLPRETAGPIETHARLFNYPHESQLKSSEDIPSLGIKTAFISNSFAAYRYSALNEICGFPINTIVSEDTYVAAKLLEAGWKIKYCADATVYHSHNYTMKEEFQRYFDLGVFHSRQPWIICRFGQAEGEGMRFVRSQFGFLRKENKRLIPSALLRTVIKYFGYRAGFFEAYLPNKIKVWLSMQKNYWDK